MFKKWRNRRAYEWHLDKIERLHKLPMMGTEQFTAIHRHALILQRLITQEKGKTK